MEDRICYVLDQEILTGEGIRRASGAPPCTLSVRRPLSRSPAARLQVAYPAVVRLASSQPGARTPPLAPLASRSASAVVVARLRAAQASRSDLRYCTRLPKRWKAGRRRSRGSRPDCAGRARDRPPRALRRKSRSRRRSCRLPFRLPNAPDLPRRRPGPAGARPCLETYARQRRERRRSRPGFQSRRLGEILHWPAARTPARAPARRPRLRPPDRIRGRARRPPSAFGRAETRVRGYCSFTG